MNMRRMHSDKDMQFRYDIRGKTAYRGNTHIHTDLSDGGTAPLMTARMYKQRGYDFLCFTDHWKCAGPELLDQMDLLAIPGVELDAIDETGVYYHVVAIGAYPDFEHTTSLRDALSGLRKKGALVILAHPSWLGLSTDECLHFRFDGVEIYNHICGFLNGKSNGAFHFETVLAENPFTFLIAADDAHIKPEHPAWNGGWISVWADRLDRDSILAGIRAGNFYATQGPEIKSIGWDGETLAVETSPARAIRLVGPASKGRPEWDRAGGEITRAAFQITPRFPWRIEVEDAERFLAWSNPVFVPDRNAAQTPS